MFVFFDVVLNAVSLIQAERCDHLLQHGCAGTAPVLVL